MATTEEEIERRVDEADTVRRARRSAAATRVGKLAARRAEIAEQLSEIERELGDVLVESSDVIEIGELAKFTDVPAGDLTRWLTDRKTIRTRRKKSPRIQKQSPPVAARDEKTFKSPGVPLMCQGSADNPVGVT